MEQPHFKDYFSKQSQDYALFRPHYPDMLGKILSELSPDIQLALDVGCGSGQFSEVLANYFDQVIAIDGSAEQLAQAARDAHSLHIGRQLAGYQTAQTRQGVLHRTALA